jgi:tRNA 2-thiouridine synthesizing protein E
MKPRRPEGLAPVPPFHARQIVVDGQALETDAEGYLVDREQWSEAFARTLAAQLNLDLTDEHWQVLRFIRNHWRTKGRLASTRQMVRHFRTVWGEDRGSAAHLFRLFERGGGPEKLGNRLAGVPRAKGDA